jgi:hypothetical protein
MKEVGIGTRIKNIRGGKQVDFELRFKVPFESCKSLYDYRTISQMKLKQNMGI